MKKLIWLLIFLAGTASAAWSADIKVLAIGALQPGLGNVAEQFGRTAAHNVSIQGGTAAQVSARLSTGEAVDVLIATPEIVEQAIKDGRAVASTAAIVGKIGIGIAIRGGETAPNVGTLESFKRALLAADSIIYNQGSSGQYLEKLFAQLGIAEQIKPKTTRFPAGGEVIDRVLQGKGADIGLIPVTAIKTAEPRGLRLVPLPSEAQNYTSYTAVVMTGAQASNAARDFVRYMTSPAARLTFAGSGVE